MQWQSLLPWCTHWMDRRGQEIREGLLTRTGCRWEFWRSFGHDGTDKNVTSIYTNECVCVSGWNIASSLPPSECQTALHVSWSVNPSPVLSSRLTRYLFVGSCTVLHWRSPICLGDDPGPKSSNTFTPVREHKFETLTLCVVRCLFHKSLKVLQLWGL